MTLTKQDVTTSLTGKWKSYPAYKDSGVEWLGEIPEHWEVRRLKFVAKFFGGGTPSKENLDFWSGDIPWVSPKDMKAEIIYDAEDHITEYALEHSATRLIQPGAVLIVVRSGILKHSIPVAINVQPVALNQDMKALVVEPFLKAEYLGSLIRGHQHALLMEWRKEGATVESVEFELLANTPCLVPVLSEQHSIATFLDRETAKINTLIAKKERLVELLQEKRAALINQAVTKGLDPTVSMKDSGIEWLGKIPAHWEALQLKRRWRVIDCKHRTATYTDDGIPIVSTTEVKPGRLNLENTRLTSEAEFLDLSEGRLPKRGDIIYSRNASVGSAAYVDTYERFCMGQDVCLITSINQDQLFLSYLLDSSVVRRQLDALMVGSTIQRINVGQIQHFWVNCPPQDEQHAIATFLDHETAKIDALISRIREGIEKLKEYSTALISAAVTGKIDVRGTVIDNNSG
jgi:type I restriction enzyme, S subunit